MPRVNGLTQKQKDFCQYVVAGYTYTDAYLAAYDSKSKSTAMVEGSKLMLKQDIQDYIKTLNKPKEDSAIITSLSEREKQIDEIKQRIAICKDKEDENSLIRYYDMLNKIYALYKDSEPQQQTDNKLNNIDNDTLKRLTAI